MLSNWKTVFKNALIIEIIIIIIIIIIMYKYKLV